jgi:hypothetical protein
MWKEDKELGEGSIATRHDIHPHCRSTAAPLLGSTRLQFDRFSNAFATNLPSNHSDTVQIGRDQLSLPSLRAEGVSLPEEMDKQLGNGDSGSKRTTRHDNRYDVASCRRLRASSPWFQVVAAVDLLGRKELVQLGFNGSPVNAVSVSRSRPDKVWITRGLRRWQCLQAAPRLDGVMGYKLRIPLEGPKALEVFRAKDAASSQDFGILTRQSKSHP